MDRMWGSTDEVQPPMLLPLPVFPLILSTCNWRSSLHFRILHDSQDYAPRCPSSRRHVNLVYRRKDGQEQRHWDSLHHRPCCCWTRCSTHPCSRSCPAPQRCCLSVWSRIRSWHSPCCCSWCLRCYYCCCTSRHRSCCRPRTRMRRRATVGRSLTDAGGGSCMGTCPAKAGSLCTRMRTGRGRLWPCPCLLLDAGVRRSRIVQSMSSWLEKCWSVCCCTMERWMEEWCLPGIVSCLYYSYHWTLDTLRDRNSRTVHSLLGSAFFKGILFFSNGHNL